MGQIKPWYASKTLWGVFITVIGIVANQYLKVPLDAIVVDKETLALIDGAEVLKSETTIEDVVSKVTVVLGLALSIYGRIKADMKIA